LKACQELRVRHGSGAGADDMKYHREGINGQIRAVEVGCLENLGIDFPLTDPIGRVEPVVPHLLFGPAGGREIGGIHRMHVCWNLYGISIRLLTADGEA
jgi:hypothetical protein